MKDTNHQQKTRLWQRPWEHPDSGSRLWRRVRLLFALFPLAAVALAERHLEQSELAKEMNLRLVVLLFGALLFILLLGRGCCYLKHLSAQTKREAIRRYERMMLFRLAQRKMPWHVYRATQVVLAGLGLCLFLLGFLLEIQAANASSSLRDGPLVLGIASSLGGLFLLLESLIVLPRHLRKLPSQCATLLRDRLLAEEGDLCPVAEQEKVPDDQ